ncbi:hypothetical protein M9H77_01725 [Catharanthus roseus]|uniref:Uncharacterized protein n=1 Tax=Catharanthus roseus TaxID=4058 RepID=A0ACC0C6B5_CATRO|nr:hypothetical protein M9H77_01725 [Catharanthus roseus]
MDATHPIRVVLFWDSEIARDAYGFYFAGLVKKSWTFNRMVTHAELVRKISKHREMDLNLWSVRKKMRMPSFYEGMNDNKTRYLWTIRPNIAKEGIHMVYDEPSMLYPTVDEDDDENDHSDEDYPVSSESQDEDNTDVKEEDIQTTLNSVNSNIVTQWQSDQWFSSATYDYTQSRAFLDMGSGELLDWNNVMTDIQLGMRFVDKVQAINEVQKLSIRLG